MHAYVKSKATQCIRKFDTRNPFMIADALNVEVFYANLGRVLDTTNTSNDIAVSIFIRI